MHSSRSSSSCSTAAWCASRSAHGSPAPFRKDYHGPLYSIASGIVLTLVVVLLAAVGRDALGSRRRWRVLLLLGCTLLALALFVWSALSITVVRYPGHRAAPCAAPRQGLRARPVRSARAVPVDAPSAVCRRPPCVSGRIPVMTADRLLFSMLWSAWVIAATYLEERDLVREFGAQYTEYQTARADAAFRSAGRGHRTSGDERGCREDPATMRQKAYQ